MAKPPITTIGGFQTLRDQLLSLANGGFDFEAQAPLPALVLGHHGHGRTAAFLSDVAPHWVGGLVDWGPSRVTAQASGAPAIEVGSGYAQFWRQLLTWAIRSD